MSNYGTNFIDQATLRNPILKHACMGQIATVYLVQVYVMHFLKILPLTYPNSVYFLICLFSLANTGTMMHGHYKCTSNVCTIKLGIQ